MRTNQTLFDALKPTQHSLHLYLNLQERYLQTMARENTISPSQEKSYRERLTLRLKLLLDVIHMFHLPFYEDYVIKALPDAPENLIKQLLHDTLLTKIPNVTKRPEAKEKTVILFSGSPGAGKEAMLANRPTPEGAVILKRDHIFPQLPPFTRLTEELTHNVTLSLLGEAALYTERDAFFYALLAETPIIVVSAAMHFADLTLEMLTTAKKHGYTTHIIHLETPLSLARSRQHEAPTPCDDTILGYIHLACAHNFLNYREVADLSELWVTPEDGTPPVLETRTQIIPLEEAKDSTYIAAEKTFTYAELMEHNGTIQRDNEAITLHHREDTVLVEMLRAPEHHAAFLNYAKAPLDLVPATLRSFTSLIDARTKHAL